MRTVKLEGQAMMNGSCPARPRQRRALGIGDRYQRQLRELAVQRLEGGDIESAVERRDHGHRAMPREREMNAVGMAMDYVEEIGPRENGLDEERVQRGCGGRLAAEAHRAVAYCHELGRRARVAAREERHPMPLPDQLFREIRDHALRAAVELWRNALVERRYLSDAQGRPRFKHRRLHSKTHTRRGAK